MKTTLILGGGTGGIVTANELRRKLGKEQRIILIDKQMEYLFEPSLLWLMVGDRNVEKITRSREELVKKGIEFVNGEIEAIDPDNRSIKVNGEVLKGDYIVISLGAELHDPPQLEEQGYNFYSCKGAQGFWEQLRSFKAGKMVVLISSLPFKCPAAPYEAAILIEDYFRKNGLRNDVEMELYSPEPGPMGVAGKEVSDMVRKMVEGKGIKYFPEHQWHRAGNGTITFENGAEVKPDLLAYVPQHQCPKVVFDAGLTNGGEWMNVDKETMETGYEGDYSIGDINGIMLSMGKPLPKAGVFAHNQGEAVAQNIAADIIGEKGNAVFTGDGECFIETGDGKAGFGKGNFYAEPSPDIKLYQPGKHWHQGKLLFEKDFLRHFGKTGPVLDKMTGFLRKWL